MPINTAVLLYPGCILYEIAAATELLASHGEVCYFTPDGNVLNGSNGMRVQPEGAYSTFADNGRFDCVLVPGGNPDSIIPEGLANKALAKANEHQSVIGGICAGVLVIASTGLLSGRTITHNYTKEHAPAEIVAAASEFWRDTNFVRSDCISDGRFVTAQPWATTRFAAEIARSLGIFNEGDFDSYMAKATFTYGQNGAD